MTVIKKRWKTKKIEENQWMNIFVPKTMSSAQFPFLCPLPLLVNSSATAAVVDQAQWIKLLFFWLAAMKRDERVFRFDNAMGSWF